MDPSGQRQLPDGQESPAVARIPRDAAAVVLA